MVVAILLRLIAAMLSKGFMASDDHYETVYVAFNWIDRGMFTTDGNMIWRHHTDGIITRFPLYTVFLYCIMRIYDWFGVQSLDTIMYGVRAVHGAISLIGVYAVYRIVALVTKSTRWAVAAGLVMAAQAMMPFLAVRQLIEMVSGSLFVLSLYWIYRYLYAATAKSEERWLWWAGVLTAVAGLIRLQIGAAALPIPFVLWWQDGRIGPALKYVAGGAIVMLLAGLSDYFVVGRFAGTLIGTLLAGHEQHYNTVLLVYPLVLLGFFIPPFSLFATAACFTRGVWRKHKLLILSITSFVLLHMLSENRQERFMIPIVGPLAALFFVALWQHFQAGGWMARYRKLWWSVVGVSVVINVALLAVFTPNYGHKGVVEPFVIVQGMSPRPRVVMVSPDHYRIYPIRYAGLPPLTHVWINRWEELDERYAPVPGTEDLFLLYPKQSSDLPEYLARIEPRTGPLEPAFHVGPSTVDALLHMLNPKYNPTHECFAYRRPAKR